MTALRSIRLVMARELRQRLRSRGFFFSTVIILLFVGAVLTLPAFARSEDRFFRVGLQGEGRDGLAEVLETFTEIARGEIAVAVRLFDDRESAERALRGSTVDALIIDASELIFFRRVDSNLRQIANEAVFTLRLPGELRALGITSDQAAPLLESDVLAVQTLETAVAGRDGDDSGASGRRWMVLAGSWMLFVSITTYGQWVLLGVIEEKATRVVEVLLATLPPYQLIAGKVVGIGLLGLLQLSLVILLAWPEIALTGSFDIPEGAFAGMGAVVLWFALGFAFYAVAFALAGALVGRQEDAQYGSLPVVMVLLVSYAVATAVSANDLGGLAVVRVASYVPPLTPMLMPVRAALGKLAWWEVPTAAAVMVLATYGLLRLGGRIYLGGLLQTGQSVRLREAWRLARG